MIKNKSVIKKIIVLSMAGVLSIGSVTTASAISLKDSFSGGKSVYCSKSGVVGNYWRKKAWAKTEGYKGWHYVRAYIGGSKKDASGAIVDSKRRWSEGNVSTTVKTDAVYVAINDIPQSYFPTAYAKYGKE